MHSRIFVLKEVNEKNMVSLGQSVKLTEDDFIDDGFVPVYGDYVTTHNKLETADDLKWLCNCYDFISYKKGYNDNKVLSNTYFITFDIPKVLDYLKSQFSEFNERVSKITLEDFTKFTLNLFDLSNYINGDNYGFWFYCVEDDCSPSRENSLNFFRSLARYYEKVSTITFKVESSLDYHM